MVDEPHDVVKLLLARMETHPEEFTSEENGPYEVRWEEYVTGIEIHGNEVDKAAIRVGLRDILLDKIHEKVLDELLNGPDKRRKEREEHEYERNLKKSFALTQQQMQQQAQGSLQNAYANAFTNQAGAYDADLDMYRNTTGAILPVSTINQIKQALGIKK
jgi:hypothetical protein